MVVCCYSVDMVTRVGWLHSPGVWFGVFSIVVCCYSVVIWLCMLGGKCSVRDFKKPIYQN